MNRVVLPASNSGPINDARGPERPMLGERLVANGIVTRAQLDMALSIQKRTGSPIGATLVDLGLTTQQQINSILFEDAGVVETRLSGNPIDRSLVFNIPLDRLRELAAIPIARNADEWTIAVADPSDILVADALSLLFPGTRRIVGASKNEILACLRDLNASNSLPGAEDGGSSGDAVASLRNIMETALSRRATDIHIEPEEKLTRVRYRVDGVLTMGPTFPGDTANAIISRLKLLSNLDISIKRLPQDGRFRHQTDSGVIDCRVSTIPSLHGENTVVRILDTTQGLPRLSMIQLEPSIERALIEAVAKPHGIIYITGATGSGKTTTLYALLSSIDAMQRKVCTVEDPVEYKLPLARQSQVHAEIGFDFATALRALLRQDPDVILIGETRDSETAGIALRSALTGHMVLSTLHANGVASAAARLVEMGVEPFLLASSLTAIFAQTLLRRVCKQCSTEAVPRDAEAGLLHKLGVTPPALIRTAHGCSACGHSGYRGRCAVGELLVTNPRIVDAIQKKRPAFEIQAIALESGMIPIEQAAAARVVDGITTIAELSRAFGYSVPEAQ